MIVYEDRLDEPTLKSNTMTIFTRNTEILRSEVVAHLKADALVSGKYWFEYDNDVGGKGCFISCLTHSRDPAPAFERFGLPVAVLLIAEGIFDVLPDVEGRAFFAALPDAVGRDGKDLSRVHWAFLAAELRVLSKKKENAKTLTGPAIVGMSLLASGREWPVDAAAYVAHAASSRTNPTVAHTADAVAFAASAATCVADAAKYSARAASAVRAAHSANDAAYSTACLRQRDTLLALISTS